MTRQNNINAKLYADFKYAITAAFSWHPTPILVPPSAKRELMKNKAYLINNTIYQTDLNFVYQYGYVHIVLPICNKTMDMFEILRIIALN